MKYRVVEVPEGFAIYKRNGRLWSDRPFKSRQLAQNTADRLNGLTVTYDALPIEAATVTNTNN